MPEVVAAGEHIGPGTDLTSFLMVAELTDCEPLNESLPRLADRLEAKAFDRFKRIVIEEMARMTANLHAARVFHKDLYLCHFFLDPDQVETAGRALPHCPDRLAPAGGAPSLAELVAMEGPGAIALLDRRCRRNHRPRSPSLLEVLPPARRD